jgi:hypothetical protein
LRGIAHFSSCSSLCRIKLPVSVELITSDGFSDCTSLSEMAITSDSHLREIASFSSSSALCRTKFLASTEIIGGFAECTPLREVLFPANSWIRAIPGFRGSALGLLRILPSVTAMSLDERAFLAYRDANQLKQSRHRLDLSLPRFTIQW